MGERLHVNDDGDGIFFILNYFIVDAMNIIMNRLIMAGLSEGLRREPTGEDVRKSLTKKM